MKKKILSLITAGLMLFTVGCGMQGEQGIAGKNNEQVTLNLSVAASLTDCMETMEAVFNEQYPHIHLQFNFGSSGALQQQIEQGAPCDIFFSASMKQMNALKDEGLMDETSIEEALKNRLALVVPANSEEVFTFATLKDADVDKFAVGEVGTVPASQYTMEVFDHLNVMSTLEPHLVYAKDVREVLSWVETGNATAGVVYETDAKITDKVKISDLADDSLHSPIIYPVGIVKASKEIESAKCFMDFLKTDTAKQIFIDYGFTPIF